MQLGGIDRRKIDSHGAHLPDGKCRHAPASIGRTGGRTRGPPQLTSLIRSCERRGTRDARRRRS
ncbi:hypothetical protein A8D61_11225 [Burkholderia cenocepacia]|nr:hypothetical protein A8D61_11225 [Burkholderia cenocepacia]ONJ18649.1 hypothetical protein A8D82_06455 [Burkholderia cenocepacia]ONN80062.1 hypothetical protein A8D63_32250 [Burkholderia cenocepacia]ONN86529.1 hypothetical protein A8D64_17990 [Burkholderia cenocepacia]ONN88210.1 hypothetical protein A8D62_21405 [Burkholderia cenocepacia]